MFIFWMTSVICCIRILFLPFPGFHETDQKVIHIPNTTAEIMGNIIEYVYTKEAKVTPENVERLLPAADYFQVMGLMKVSVLMIFLPFILYMLCKRENSYHNQGWRSRGPVLRTGLGLEAGLET